MTAQALDDYVLASTDAVVHSAVIPGGSIDTIKQDRIVGWCVDPLDPGAPAKLELRLGRLLLGAFETDVERHDIARCFGVETPCGFLFDFADIPYERARDALSRRGKALAAAPFEQADLRVTVRDRRVELPRWEGDRSVVTNANLLRYLRASHPPEAVGWFDADWYRAQNPIVGERGLDPFEHYRDHGRKQGRPPNPVIAAAVGAVGIKPYNPLAGPQARMAALIAESGLFDTGWYAARYGVPTDEAVAHYVKTGGFLGYDPSPFFSSLGYIAEHLEGAKAGFNPLAHLILRGFEEAYAVDTLPEFRLTARDWLKGI